MLVFISDEQILFPAEIDNPATPAATLGFRRDSRVPRSKTTSGSPASPDDGARVSAKYLMTRSYMSLLPRSRSMSSFRPHDDPRSSNFDWS
ncbi:hypothetical protein L1987_44556 [Smallanthus sonchifolius]|uniref:Uncharacterized protein n=1 Tax=Smallanthus sonchifolius TaxID=185202 RepID=A0ACB9GPJ0_9ASTR|nr:hypothetical protein L1987_44556 [Smallanthus sonchifolius]